MKNLTKGLCLLLCLLFALTGCSGEKSTAAKGRYMEREVSLPADIQSGAVDFKRMEDGSLWLYGLVQTADNSGGYHIWQSTDDGTTWTDQSYPWLEEDMLLEAYQISVSIRSPDEIYILTMELDYGEVEDPAAQFPDFIYTVLQGSKERLTVMDLDLGRSEGALQSLDAGPDGGLLVNDLKVTEFIDEKTGAVRQSFNTDQELIAGTSFVYNNTLLTAQQSKIVLYDLSTGQLTAELPYAAAKVPEEMLWGSSDDTSLIAITMEEGGQALYYGDETGIYRCLLDGSVTERVLDGELCSLGMPTVYLRYLLQGQGNSFLTLCTTNDRKVKLFRYVYDPAAFAMPSTELRVYSLEDNPTVRQAMGQFQLQNPDVKVSYGVGLTGTDSIPATDALRSLTTELLAGKGPDVLVLDDLPMDSYIQNGVLADLSGLLDKDIAAGALLPNVAETFRRGDSLYAVPARFTVPMLYGDTQAGSLKELVDWVSEQPNQRMGITAPNLLRRFYPVLSGGWFREDGSLNEAAFTADLADLGRLAQPVRDLDARDMDEDHGNLMFIPLHIKGNLSCVGLGTLGTISDIASPYTMMEQEGHGSLGLFPRNGVYRPAAIMAVNAASDKQELAQQFLRYTLSEENQTIRFEDGLPINAAALAANAANESAFRSGLTVSYDDPETGEEAFIQFLLSRPSDAIIESVIASLKGIATPVLENAVVRELILAETAGYFTGESSLEETVQALTSKLNLYLAE